MTLLLKDLVRQDAWTPLQNNIAVCLLTVFYCKMALEGIAWLRLRFGMTAAASYSKPLVYLLLSTGTVFGPLFDISDWSWRLNAVVPTAMLVRFVYKVRDDDDAGSLPGTACIGLTNTPDSRFYLLRTGCHFKRIGRYRSADALPFVVTVGTSLWSGPVCRRPCLARPLSIQDGRSRHCDSGNGCR